MNHGEANMNDKDQGNNQPDEESERELIDLEFAAMVEGLSLDESAPTSYLDELDKFDENNKFKPPTPPKLTARETFERIKISFRKWKGGPAGRDDDGAAL